MPVHVPGNVDAGTGTQWSPRSPLTSENPTTAGQPASKPRHGPLELNSASYERLSRGENKAPGQHGTTTLVLGIIRSC